MQVGVKPNMSQPPIGRNLEHGKLKDLFEKLKLQIESQMMRIEENQEPVQDMIILNAKKHVKEMTKKEILRVQLENSETEKKQLAIIIGQNLSPNQTPQPANGGQSPNINEERHRIKAEQKEREMQLREERIRQQKENELKQQEERNKMLRNMGIDTNR